MGEHMKDLCTIDLKGKRITIELNKMDFQNKKYDIHIEVPPFRYNMTDYEFMQIAASVAEAKRKLLYKRESL